MIKSFRATRAQLRARREAREQYKVLKSELADYVTDADRFDIEAMLDRYPDEATRDLRQILSVQGTRAISRV